jgi:predicted NUDIX family NTP pyrophosphohydrolase
MEETGAHPRGEFRPLGELTQPGRKIVTAFAVEGDFDPATLKSNTFELEWPPKSGRKATFPEVDRAEWFSPEIALQKILQGQREFITRLLEMAPSNKSRHSHDRG